MVNTEIRQFRDSIIAMTNACPLPIEIKRLVFVEIQMQICDESDRIISTEKAEKENQNNAQEENKDEETRN